MDIFEVIFIQPPLEDFYSTDCRTQPVGLAYLASSVKKKFPLAKVQIFDFLSCGPKRSVPWPNEFQYLKKYYGLGEKSHFGLFEQYFRFGKNAEEMTEELKESSPLLIGISSLFSPYYRQSLEAAKVCRELFPDTSIVFGGNHATSAPESLLNSRLYKASGKDFVIKGEGEELICDLIEHLKNPESFPFPEEIVTTQNFSRKENIGLKLPDIKDLPAPDFSLLDKSIYILDKKPLRFCITSRGCPYRCSFCGIHSVFGKKYRRRDNENILQEIKQNIAEGVFQIDFEDDHFTAQKKETLNLLENIISLKKDLKLSLMNGLVYWTLDKEILIKMKDAGFSSLNLSLVSQDDSMTESAKRPLDLSRFKNVVMMARDLDFFIITYFIIGRPGQTLSEMISTLKFLSGLPVLIGASPYYLSPGSPDYDNFKNHPELTFQSAGNDHFFSARLTAMDIEGPGFLRDDIYTLLRLSRLINYIKKGIDLGLLPAEDYFKSVKRIINDRNFNSIESKKPVPCSEKIIEEIFSQKTLITGPRTGISFEF